MADSIPAKIPEKALERYGMLSDPAKAWLTAVLDPFHDYQFDRIAGFPSIGSMPSVVQVLTKNYTVSKPAGAAAGAWQCSVFYTGLTGGALTAGTSRANDEHKTSYVHGAALAKMVGPVTVMAESSLMEMIPDYTVATMADNPVSTSPYRVIGVGIEVHNTTAPLYKGGVVTVALLPPWTRDGDDVVYYDTGASPYADRWVRTDYLGGIPVSDAQLRAIPSSRTWDASDGVYMVPRMYETPIVNSYWEDKNNLIEFQSTGQRYFHTQPQVSVVTSMVSNYPAFQSHSISGFTPMMALFSGLSDQTTLTITCKTIVESFPIPSNPLAPLATPGCPFDADAMRAYSAISAEAPYAVKVGQNAAGDFFKSIIQVARVAAPALGLIPHVGGALRAAAPGVLDLAEKVAGIALQDVQGKLESKVDAAAVQRMKSSIGASLSTRKKKPPGKRPALPPRRAKNDAASISGTPTQ